MENQQMAMPAEMAPAGPNPEEMAIYEQMRQQISPQEFSNEMLAGASQVDPQAVAEFTQELQGLDMPPEALDALNDVVDEILASPERYAELRAQYMEQGLPEDILPEQFDPQFFAALNMAIDQMIAAPTGVQAFAQGGIAELKPIAKAIASYGRNGDTMLAHITPAEARMLRRRGGSGTINPKTGLPEFFLKKLFKGVGKALKSVGKAVKKFASSSIGRIVTTVALGFFLGPAAASFLGATSVAGVAAVSGFVGSAGSTLLAGGNLKDALKAGAVGGLTAGAGAGLMGGAEAFAANSASTAGLTPGQAFSGQVDKFTNVFSPGTAAAPTPGLDAAGQAPVPDAGDITSKRIGIDYDGVQAPPPAPSGSLAYDLNMQAQQAAANQAAPGNVLTDNVTTSAQRDAFIANQGLGKPSPSFVDQTKQFLSDNISPSGIREGATPAAQKAGADAVNSLLQRVPSATPAMQEAAYQQAFKSAMPGVLSTYGPMAAVGLGTMAAFGGFDSKPVQGGEITNSLMKPVTQRIQEAGTQRQMYMQGLPGVVYDDYGAPVFGQSTRLPTYDVPDYNSGGFGSQGQGIMNLPSVYIPPPGTIGSRRVEQPYNNADMYSNLVPRGYADGGTVTDLFRSVLRRDPSSAEIDSYRTQFGDSIDERERALFREAAAPELTAQRASAAELATQQKAARDKVAQQKALRRSQGSGQMYANINAGLSALAPENFPGTPAALAPDRLKTIQDAYAGIAARPVNEVSDAERYQVAQQGKFSPAELAAAFPEVGFGEINRIMGRGAVQQNYAPMLSGQRNAMAEQARILGGRVPVAQPPVDAGGPITTMPVAPPGTPGGRPVPPDFSNDPGASVGPGMSYTQDQMPSEGGISIQGGFDEYGKLYGSEPYHYGRGPKPKSSTTAQAPAANPYSNITNPYSNITNPQPGYTGPNLYAQTLAMGMPSRDAMLPAYQYTPLAEGATRKPTIATPTASSTGDMARKQAQYQALLGQGATDAQIRYAGETMFGPQTNADMAVLQGGSKRFMNMGGIAALAKGGYPRRNGQINGPGTEKSDSIPAMLSDGEFVMTAKAVRGAGKGNRRAGAKQMYKLMHQLEKNAERG
jgi:hypothetical protein